MKTQTINPKFIFETTKYEDFTLIHHTIDHGSMTYPISFNLTAWVNLKKDLVTYLESVDTPPNLYSIWSNKVELKWLNTSIIRYTNKMVVNNLTYHTDFLRLLEKYQAGKKVKKHEVSSYFSSLISELETVCHTYIDVNGNEITSDSEVDTVTDTIIDSCICR